MASSLPVESSWRMVEGDHDSFDTSVVPNEDLDDTDLDNHLLLDRRSRVDDADDDDPFLPRDGGAGGRVIPTVAAGSARLANDQNSMAAASSQGNGGVGGGGSGGGGDGSGGGGSYSSVTTSADSQEEDLHAFLRRAETDGARALLRSPFQPSLPSSVRHSLPGGSGGRGGQAAYQTPEPELRMPVLDAEGSAQRGGGGGGGGGGFWVSSTGSPVPRRRQRGVSGGSGSSSRRRRLGSSAEQQGTALPAHHHVSATAAWRTALLPLLVAVVAVVACCCCLGDSLSARLGALPAITVPGLSSAHGPHGQAQATAAAMHGRSRGRDAPPAQPDDLGYAADDLMRWQTQLVDVVRARVPMRKTINIGNGGRLLPYAQNAWLVPRARTKDMRTAIQMQSRSSSCRNSKDCSSDDQTTARNKNYDTLLLIELDAYLDDARRVSAALARLQAGAAGVTADPLAHRTHQTLAQLRRLASEAGNGKSATEPSLRDIYGRHAGAVLAKTADRVHEAAAVVEALTAAGRRLDGVAGHVATRRDELVNGRRKEEEEEDNKEDPPPSEPGGSLLARFWARLFGPSPAPSPSPSPHAWTEYVTVLETLQVQHAEAAARAVDTLDELAAVQDALDQLQSRFGGSGGNGRVHLQLHIDIVAGGIRELEERR